MQPERRLCYDWSMMAKIDHKPYLADGNRDFFSLVKLTGGIGIKDIIGHPGEYGEFTIFSVVLENGKSFFAGGSHDNPYLYDYGGAGGKNATFVVPLGDLSSPYGDDDEEDENE